MSTLDFPSQHRTLSSLRYIGGLHGTEDDVKFPAGDEAACGRRQRNSRLAAGLMKASVVDGELSPDPNQPLCSLYVCACDH